MGIPILYANDVDLYATYGFAPTNLDGWWDRPQINRDTVSPYGLLGVVPAPLARTRAQEWPLEGVVVAETPAERRSKVDALNGFLQGVTEWRLADADRVAYGEVVGSRSEITRRGRWGDDGKGSDLRLRLFVAFYDAAKYDRLATVVEDIGSTPVEVPQGSSASLPVVTITGAATDPVLIGRDEEGTEIGRLGLIHTLGAVVEVEIDMANHTVTYPAGTPANGLATMDFENTWFFSLPKGTPTLEVTSGTATAEYRKRWL